MRSRFLQNLVWPGQRCKVSFKSNLSKPLCMFSLQSCQTCGEPLFGSVDLCQHFQLGCKENLNTNPFPASSLKTSVPTCSRLDHVSLSSELWLQKFVFKFLYSVPLTVFTIASQCRERFDIRVCTEKKKKKVTITAKRKPIFPKFTRSYKSNINHPLLCFDCSVSKLYVQFSPITSQSVAPLDSLCTCIYSWRTTPEKTVLTSVIFSLPQITLRTLNSAIFYCKWLTASQNWWFIISLKLNRLSGQTRRPLCQNLPATFQISVRGRRETGAITMFVFKAIFLCIYRSI